MPTKNDHANFGPSYFIRALSVFGWLHFFQGKLLENKINEINYISQEGHLILYLCLFDMDKLL